MIFLIHKVSPLQDDDVDAIEKSRNPLIYAIVKISLYHKMMCWLFDEVGMLG